MDEGFLNAELSHVATFHDSQVCWLWGAVCLKTTKIELFININNIY